MSNQSTSFGRAPQPPAGYPSNIRNFISPRLFATGGNAATNAADFNNSTPVITEIYISEMLVTHPTHTTGASVFAGSVWSDSLKVGLYDANGVLLMATDSTAGNTTADAYQNIPWAQNFYTGAAVASTTGYDISPGTYYIGVILNGTTSRLNTHVVGAFGSGKLTGHVYATAMVTTGLNVNPPVTFTTALGPVVSLY